MLLVPIPCLASIVKVASENQLADTFTKGLALDQFVSLQQKFMGWTAEARQGVSRVELTKSEGLETPGMCATMSSPVATA
jgi:hypothetical protein